MDCTCRQEGVLDNINPGKPKYREKAYDLHEELIAHPVHTVAELYDYIQLFGFQSYNSPSFVMSVRNKRLTDIDGEPPRFAKEYTLHVEAIFYSAPLTDATSYFPHSESGHKFKIECSFVGSSEKECAQKAAFAFKKTFQET